MTLQHQRIVVFTIASILSILILVNLFTSDFVWYSIFEYLVLLPSVLSVVLLIRVWVYQYKHYKYTEWRRKLESINPSINEKV